MFRAVTVGGSAAVTTEFSIEAAVVVAGPVPG